MLGAPGGEELHDGAKGLAFGGEGVFDAGWDFGVGGAGDEAVLFEFFELAGEDFEGHAGMMRWIPPKRRGPLTFLQY